MKVFNYIFYLLILACVNSLLAQDAPTVNNMFILKGRVIDELPEYPLANVNVEIPGGDYTVTNTEGLFSIKAKKGDGLIIRSELFKTVYYVIKDDEFVTVKVTTEKANTRNTNTTYQTQEVFLAYLDSAKTAKVKDAKSSIEYITKALQTQGGKSPTQLQKGMAFETLGDIYMHWQLYDLAADNYKRSIANQYTIDRTIKLAQAYTSSGAYQEALAIYINLTEGKLSNNQKLLVYEGQGDTYKATGEITQSVLYYQKALNIATLQDFSTKITNLNSKIGDAYAKGGETAKAEAFYKNALELSKKVSVMRAAEEKDNVANFYNKRGDFKKEIVLREEALEDVEEFENTTPASTTSAVLSSQRQNYKIANAYIGQSKLIEAIPYLEKSIDEADAKEDLYVEKDARRKLSEVYRDIGAYDKAAEGYERYVEVVDELYIKKEQELSQAARFAREIALKENRIAGLENERELNESRYQLAFENQALIASNNTIQRWIIGSLILVALLLLITAYTQFKNIKQQKFANNMLALKSLRSQMNPHFIFNALNSVNSFIATNDERAANKYLSEFSQLMRSVLENSEEDFIPLHKEIELLELYTKLEHFRFKDKFDYQITIDEAIPLDAFVIPPMLLQPYIENAVWHGLRYKEEKGLLTINFIKIDHNTIKITIKDNGIGRSKSAALKTENQKKQNSKGMGNIKKRISILNDMYRDKVDVLIRDAHANGTGTLVTLIIKKD